MTIDRSLITLTEVQADTSLEDLDDDYAFEFAGMYRRDKRILAIARKRLCRRGKALLRDVLSDVLAIHDCRIVSTNTTSYRAAHIYAYEPYSEAEEYGLRVKQSPISRDISWSNGTYYIALGKGQALRFYYHM